jgi:hypothetical protein
MPYFREFLGRERDAQLEVWMKKVSSEHTHNFTAQHLAVASKIITGAEDPT